MLAGYAKHPNVAAYLLIGLGCEVNQAAVMVEQAAHGGARASRAQADRSSTSRRRAGSARRSTAPRQEVAKLLPFANEARRTPQPISELMLATNCGGSDGNSGITANPALGWAVDELVRYGGTGVLAETPEIYGAEHLLIRRAVSEGVGEKLIDRYKWWEWYCRGIEAMDNNPAPGNKAGGITTIFEKSLGGVTKGGTTPMMDVFLLRRADHHARLRVHGYAGPRSGVDHRPGRGRLQHDLLHHGPRLGLRLQARALDQARHELASCTATWRTTWTSTAASILEGTPVRDGGPADLRGDHRGRVAASGRRASSPASARKSSRPGSSAR